MARGRKPKPTALKALGGNLRNPMSQIASVSITKIPNPPKWFSPLARKIYKDTTVHLRNSHVLVSVDLQMLVAYCQEYANYLEIMEKVSNGTEPQVIEVKTKTGMTKIVNPIIKIAQGSLEKAKMIASEYGLTPSSRTKVNVVMGKDVDEFEAFLSKRG